MSVLPIVTPTDNETILRTPAAPVSDWRSPELQTLIDNMIETMRAADGVGLAAPQVGLGLRLAVIETLPEYDEDDNPIEGSRQLFVLLNPQIIWESRKRVSGVEGCLSIPNYLGEVERAFAITVTAQDRYGHSKRYRLNGWDARIFQHEIDHLNGVLYIDKLTAPDRYWTEEEYEAYRQARDAQALAE